MDFSSSSQLSRRQVQPVDNQSFHAAPFCFCRNVIKQQKPSMHLFWTLADSLPSPSGTSGALWRRMCWLRSFKRWSTAANALPRRGSGFPHRAAFMAVHCRKHGRGCHRAADWSKLRNKWKRRGKGRATVRRRKCVYLNTHQINILFYIFCFQIINKIS